MGIESGGRFIPETEGYKSEREMEDDKKIKDAEQAAKLEFKAELLNNNALEAEKFKTKTDLVGSMKDISFEPESGFVSGAEAAKKSEGEMFREKNEGGVLKAATIEVAADSLFKELQKERKEAQKAAAEGAEMKGE